MGTNLASDTSTDEDYINMELTSSPSKAYICSSPHSRDFEFKMFSTPAAKETTADELFCNGKLLPLYLTSAAAATARSLPSTASCTNATTTPSDSRNISPSESCRVSCDLNPDDTFFHWSHELTTCFIKNHHHTKHPWPKKLKQKLKSSRAYLKSLFAKSADESSADKYLKIGKKIAAIIKNIDDQNGHRRSFSGAVKRHSPTKCFSSSSSNSSSSSSSLSFNSNNNVHEQNLLRRSSNATEIEVSIDAAIAHCKKSMKEIDDGDDDDKGKSVKSC